MESTRELIQRARTGDQAAKEHLFTRFLPPLRRWAHGRIPGHVRSLLDTDDLVQNSVFRALSSVDRFDARGQGAFLGYLHQVLLNSLRDEIRRVERRPMQVAVEDSLPEERPGLLARTMGAGAVTAYERALASLTDLQQQAVILRIEFGFSYAEIAAVLGRPSADAVRMQIARALVEVAARMSRVDLPWSSENESSHEP